MDRGIVLYCMKNRLKFDEWVRAPKKPNITRKCHGEHLCLAGEVIGSTPIRVEKVWELRKTPV